MRVCTVIVTYNRYLLLKECVEALLKHTVPTDIVIVDNASTDGTGEYLVAQGYANHPSITIVSLSSNTGGAGGFYEGMRYARDHYYDFVWLMDDDAEPAFDGLEKLLDHTKGDYAAFASTVYTGTIREHVLTTIGHRGMFDKHNPFPTIQKPLPKEMYDARVAEIDMASFVGILIPRKSFESLDLPKKEFFIHHDDTEYCLRLGDLGKILLVKESKIYHKEMRQEEKIVRSCCGMTKNRIRYDKLWIKYFGIRNSIFIARKHTTTYKVYITILLSYLCLIKDIVLFDDHKMTRIIFATSSYIDGLRGIFDNEKPKKILNWEKKDV